MVRRARLALLFFILLPMGIASAQGDPTIELKLTRSFGYRAGHRIQGRFTVEAISDAALQEATFLIDGKNLDVIDEAPFRTSFSTGDFELGSHRIKVAAVTSSGTRLESDVVELTFVSAEESWQVGGRLSAWILGGTLLLMVAGMAFSGWFARDKSRFELGVYGAAGGAVCERCRLPFSRHVFAPSLVLGKLERCPHCGRVMIVPRANQMALDAAESRYREDQVQGQREDRLKEQRNQQWLDDSRYEG
jgi:hypothetical protein